MSELRVVESAASWPSRAGVCQPLAQQWEEDLACEVGLEGLVKGGGEGCDLGSGLLVCARHGGGLRHEVGGIFG
jgi:hypothetical protein